MKKIFLLGLVVIVCLFTVTGCVKGKPTVDEKTDIPTDIPKEVSKSLEKVPSKERRNINYDELNEDIKSLKNNKSLKHAKNNSKKGIYDGNGYYVKVIWGGEVADYVFYTYDSDTELYAVQVVYPLTNE